IQDYVLYLDEIGVDGVIVTDPGVIALIGRVAPHLPIHVSTQSNVTNGHTAAFWARQGAKRIVLARELTLEEIKGIRAILPPECEIECFAHGAMCISYSGRCLLSSYLSTRDSNRGECVQACRWQYQVSEVSRTDHPLTIEEDERGTYLLNSKDLNMIEHLADMQEAGVASIKIEGRMKTAYYVATVVNAYRRALDHLAAHPGSPCPKSIADEVFKCNNRQFCTGFYYGRGDANVSLDDSQSAGEYDFVGVILDYQDGIASVEMRNRFAVGDRLEILSCGPSHNEQFVLREMTDKDGARVEDAKIVQQVLKLAIPYPVQTGDMLRRKK
ncbi:MAG: U32 family peptidase C-terminal domain-containing protein, partial [Clostridia bacterium]|nr:U32 family peptidase C-terminal domain-containing protein [Clostridia bacterium]